MCAHVCVRAHAQVCVCMTTYLSEGLCVDLLVARLVVLIDEVVVLVSLALQCQFPPLHTRRDVALRRVQ